MKITRIVGLVALLMLCGILAKSQNDIVRLKNGSFVRGTIIEYIVGDHIKIKTEEGKIYEYPASELQKTEMGGKKSHLPFESKSHGYYNITSMQLLFGNNYGLNIGPGLHTVNGYQWNPHLMTGIGVGIEYLNRGGKIPLYADVRWNFTKGPVTPFVGLTAGYTLGMRSSQQYFWDWGGRENQKNYGGITTGLNFGLLARVSSKVGLVMSAGYRYQALKSKYDQGFWNGTELVSMPVVEHSYLHRVNICFGLLFN